MEVHRCTHLIGELLGTDTGLLVADINTLESDSGDDLPLVLETGIEVLAVLQGVSDLGGALLVEDTPAQDSSDACLLRRLGDDILGVVEVHEGGCT